MELTVMYQDKSVKKIPCRRVFITKGGSHLYYEVHADAHGEGTRIPMSDIRSWEVNAVIVGGSDNLVL